MFRSYGKAAVIAAVAASCGYVSAATIRVATPTAEVSREGATAATTATLDLGTTVDLTMGSFQSRDSVIRLSLGGISGAKFASFNAVSPSVSCTGGNITLDVTRNSSAQGTWEFGITGTSGSTSATSCSFSSLAVVASSLSSGGVLTISSAVKRVSDSDFTYDTASAATAFTVATQISSIAVLSALNGVVDYTSQQGLGFTAAGDDAGTDAAGATGYGDVLSFQVGSKEGMVLSFGSVMTFTFALNAASGKSFAWLDDAPGAATFKQLNRDTSSGRVGTTGDVTINADLNTITFKQTALMTGTARTFSVQFQHKSSTPSTGVAIDPMTFSAVTARVERGSTTSLSNTALTVGSWSSNGTTVKIPYMPINTTAGTAKIDPIIILSNRSSVTGTVTVNIVNARGESCTGTLGTISGNSTKSFGGSPLRAVLAGCSTYNTANGEQMNISLTATLPAGSTEIFTGYNADTGRVTVVNDANGK